ncbi:MAG: site-specific DNA-methyltransferase [Azonexus sp.]|nr:site-specific DNA-methyltransferase [Azonexus sp.]
MLQPTAFEQFQQFLREMFQYDNNDLDFGLFKVLRLKRNYIEQFISGDGEQDLRQIVQRELAATHSTESADEHELLGNYLISLGKKTTDAWAALQPDPHAPEKQAKLRQAIVALEEDDKVANTQKRLDRWLATQKISLIPIEAQLYNYLLNFFELYYQNGDFGYNSRASNAFKVPYEADYDGSDTLFHWKHKDSYYIKTGASFPEVKLDVLGQKIVFRLQSGGDAAAETTAQNNNKESDIKHYRLLGIAPEPAADGSPTWVLRFALASTSTPKAEIYPQLWQTALANSAPADLAPYLFEGTDNKPIFNDLGKDHDKAEGGQIKGINQLRLNQDKYRETLAKNPVFRPLGNNAETRAEALKQDATAQAIYAIDKALNRFYVGQDADYFIHKDLYGFLTREKDRFIKNVIFSDLETLLSSQIEPATLIIARGFNAVAARIVCFLDVLETFQRNLFTLKKKVVDTHWLISIGKIDAAFYPRLLANSRLITYWASEFKCSIASIEDIATQPTLVVDTSLFTEPGERQLIEEIIGSFDRLDEQTDGLLIHSENWQALNLLQDKFRERIQCIYIDPPYNTGGDGFLYKDSFRHSSWASMMEDRLVLAKEFLGPTGVLFASIDDKERLPLERLLGETFGTGNRVEELIWAQNSTKNQSPTYSNNHEYVEVFCRDLARVRAAPHMFREPKPGYSEIIELLDSLNPTYLNCEDIEQAVGKLFQERREQFRQELEDNGVEYDRTLDPWKGTYQYSNAEYRDANGKLVPDGEARSVQAKIWLWKSADSSMPKGGGTDNKKGVHTPGDPDYRFYMPDHPVTGKACPHPKRGWGFPEHPMGLSTSLEEMSADHRIAWGKSEKQIPQAKKFLHEVDTQVGKSVVNDYTDGEKQLSAITGKQRSFPNPKPTTLLERFVEQTTQPDEWVMDFFAGSGTTGHTVLQLEVRRRFVLSEMGAHFDTVLKPRIARVMYSAHWKAGKPGAANRHRHIVKVQRLEQYEDVLANLDTAWNETALPEGIPVSYLFRPEQNRIQLTLDLKRPFDNRICVGRLRQAQTIDLLESWAYLNGYWQRSRRVFSEAGRRYECLETECGTLVVLRDIVEPEDDSAALQAIAARYVDRDEDGKTTPRLRRLAVNYWANLVSVEAALPGLPCSIINAHDFDRGAEWI